jgi:hypothetical protein
MAECKCGGETRDATHTVKTIKVAQEWDSSVVESDLPIQVHQTICKGCGRTEWRTEKHT